MDQTREEMAQNLAERWCWQTTRRDDARVARAWTASKSSVGFIDWTRGHCWLTSRCLVPGGDGTGRWRQPGRASLLPF
jgi:hypothetical protein